MKRVKQINNLIIKLDNIETINYFGHISKNPKYNTYSVWTQTGICLEDNLKLEQAIEFCKEIKDYCKR